MLINKKIEEEAEFSGKQQIISSIFLSDFNPNNSLRLSSPLASRERADSFLGSEILSNVTQIQDQKYDPSESIIAWIEDTRILTDFGDIKTSPENKFDFEKMESEKTNSQRSKYHSRNVEINVFN